MHESRHSAMERRLSCFIAGAGLKQSKMVGIVENGEFVSEYKKSFHVDFRGDAAFLVLGMDSDYLAVGVDDGAVARIFTGGVDTGAVHTHNETLVLNGACL